MNRRLFSGAHPTTTDALLVADRDQAEILKDLAVYLRALHVAQAAEHRQVTRPWSWYDDVDSGVRLRVERIGVRPGSSLSLQMHHHRAERWTVVKGTDAVNRVSDTFLVIQNVSTFIPAGQTHRLHNPGRGVLEMIEVQPSSYLGEDVIVSL